MSQLQDLLYQNSGMPGQVTDKYNVIPTIDVVQQFERYGFETTQIDASRARSKNGFQKHMVRMRSDYSLAPGLRPEIIINNSYDGTKALQVRVGCFRFVCSNGLVVGSNLIPELRIVHSNNAWAELLNEFIDTYEEKHNKQKEWIENMSDYKMSLDEAYDMANRTLEFRHSDERIEIDAVDPLELLIVKRKEDRGETAWHRYNTIQENLINGYFHKVSNDGAIKKAKIMTDIDEIIRVNTELSDTFSEVLVA